MITDAYSHMIVGWTLAKNPSAQGPLYALEMALFQRKYRSQKLIYHSDRGIQYNSVAYRDLLETNRIKISMTQNGDPYENAMAERVNGIIKDEMLTHFWFTTHRKANQAIQTAIHNYNSYRPHRSCDLLTPEQAHKINGPLRKHWKKRTYKLPQELESTASELDLNGQE